MSDIKTKTIYAADREHVAFAERAATYFNEHPDCHTFTDGSVEPGKPFAVRWASPKDKRVVSVLVFELPYDAVLVGDLDVAGSAK